MVRKRRARLLDPVRWLTISEIAHLWAEELGIPESIIQRELQLGLINLPRLAEGEAPISEFPESDLPPATTKLGRDTLWAFCKKQSPWGFPRFWFSEWTAPSYPGRSSVMHRILTHFGNLDQADRLEDTLAAQARVLAEWARHALPPSETRVQPPTAHTIENAIRHDFRAAKSARSRSGQTPRNYR